MADYEALARDCLPKRIIDKINFQGPLSEYVDGRCWEWLGCLRSGYGTVVTSIVKNKNGGNHHNVHRLIFQILVGIRNTRNDIDHICFNRKCCNPAHLREVTRKQNIEHQCEVYKNNVTSQIRGAVWHEISKKWVATIQHDKTHLHLGLYDDIQEAEAVALVARCSLFSNNDVDRPLLESAQARITPEGQRYIDKVMKLKAGEVKRRTANGQSMSNVRGVRHHHCGKWQVRVNYLRKEYSLGYYDDIEEAEAVSFQTRFLLNIDGDLTWKPPEDMLMKITSKGQKHIERVLRKVEFHG